MCKRPTTAAAVSLITILAFAGCRAASTKGSDAASAPPTSPASGAPQAVIGGDPVAQVLGHVRDLLDAGQADSAIAALGPALFRAGAPLDARLPRALVLASSEAGTPWVAVRIIDELLRIRPGEVHLYVARGEIELARDRPEAGLRYFLRAILTDDTSLEAMGGFGRCRAAAGGNIGSALAYFDKLIKAKPNLASVRYGKAALYLESDLVAEASGELRRVVGLNENLWLAERDYGRALLRLADRKSALPHFEKAVRLLDAAGDPLMAERMAVELRAAAEGAGEGTGEGNREEAPGEKIKSEEEPQGY